jgi:predicted permease
MKKYPPLVIWNLIQYRGSQLFRMFVVGLAMIFLAFLSFTTDHKNTEPSQFLIWLQGLLMGAMFMCWINYSFIGKFLFEKKDSTTAKQEGSATTVEQNPG